MPGRLRILAAVALLGAVAIMVAVRDPQLAICTDDRIGCLRPRPPANRLIAMRVPSAQTSAASGA